MFGNEWLRTAECKPGAALADKARASRIFRPRLELLEDRVQLGDTILGLSAVALWGLDLPSRDAPFVLDSAGHDRQWPHGHFSRLDTLAWLSRANSRTTTSPHSKISPRSQTGVWERGRDDSGDLLATARSGLLGIDDLLASALFADPVQGLGTPAPAQGPKAHGHVSAGAGGTSLAVAAGSAVLSGATGYGSAGGLGVTQSVTAATAYSGPSAADLSSTLFSPLVAHLYPAPASGGSPGASPLRYVLPQLPAVHAGFDLSTPTSGPFPSNWFTVADDTHNTGRRVNMPLPDPSTHPSDYEDTQVLNTLDGFNLQPRLSIPFDGRIDVSTVSSKTVFLVSLGDSSNPSQHRGEVVGINQIVWDVAMTTLHAESDELLAQHTRYALIVTNGIHDTTGSPVETTQVFRHIQQTAARLQYKDELLDAVHAASDVGIPEQDIVTASVFTTESATAVLEKIRDQIHAATPAPADFNLAADGSRTVFPLDKVTGIAWNQQVRDDRPLAPTPLDLSPLRIIRGAVGKVAFGKYLSPDYEVHPGEYIPPVGTRTGTPAVQRMNKIYFNLFLPSAPRPVGGWPVAIYGHGFDGSKNDQSLSVAATMAAHGIATVAINIPGNGFGPLSTLTVSRRTADGGPVTFLAGGRGIDQDGDHDIGFSEGEFAAAPRTIISFGDGQRQTVADLMQLVRSIEVGMDVDGDGSRGLDPSRIYYLGFSIGGMYGTNFLAVEPSVRAGVANVPGGRIVVDLRLNPSVFRGEWVRAPNIAVGRQLASRIPSLINSPGVTQIDGVSVSSAPYFNENMPLRDGVPLPVRLRDGTRYDIRSPMINTVAGAMAIQEMIDNAAWVSQSSNAVAYGPHLRKDPLPGVPAKSVIYQFPKGDLIVPNPTTTAILRAGDLADRATYYRHDLAFADNSSIGKNPHAFMLLVTDSNYQAIARGAQEQIATFFASDGRDVIHPEPAKYFETPIQGPLPEGLNYIP